MPTPRRAVSSVSLAVLVALLALAPVADGARKLPRGLPADLYELLIPADNPLTDEKVELGRRVYFEKAISADKSLSCATCHDPAKGFADGKKVAEGIGGKKGTRNSPTVLNAVFNEFQFWDGRAASLEEQARGPMVNPIEMGMSDHAAVVAALSADSRYREDFKKVFGRDINIDDVVAAIAAFERTVVSGDSPADRFLAGDAAALSEPAKRGLDLWNGKARCNTCHPFTLAAPFGTDNKFHNIGVAAKNRDFAALAREAAAMDAKTFASLTHREGFAELGRFIVTRQPKDLGAFKTPGVRDIALTAPYMHDGSEATLMDVVNFYDRGGEPNPYLDGGIVPLKLTEQEKKDLVAFMESLTGQGEGSPTRAELQPPAPSGGSR
ncbi:MAG TPA: cytochrome c peroxidase [Vicinamibacteria bacterium]|nr:cytochrome c peroxidase [Vicinamibacteria bacterium]